MKQINVTMPKINVNVPKVNMPDVKKMSAKAKANLSKMPKLPVTNAPEFVSRKALKSVELQVNKILDDPDKRRSVLKYAEMILHNLPVKKETKNTLIVAQMVIDKLNGRYENADLTVIAIAYATSASKIAVNFVPFKFPEKVLKMVDGAAEWAWYKVETEIMKYQNWQNTNQMLYV